MHLARNDLLCTHIILAAVFCASIIGCTTVTEEEVATVECPETLVPKSFDHHVIGFYPSYKHEVLPVAQIRWDLLTRVIYAFAIPRSDGTIDVSRLTQASTLKAAAHEHGVEVYFSVGGGGGSEHFSAMARNPATRSRFVESVVGFVNTHCLDGVDLDWEGWTKDANNAPVVSEMNDFRALVQELDAALGTASLSLDVYAGNWNGQHYLDVHHLVDYVHVMAYDFTGPWSAPGPHSSYNLAIGSGSGASSTGLAYWNGFRKWPKSKLILGVPFYGRDFDNQGGVGIAYRDIIALDAEAPNKDRVNNIYYNGVQTIADKAQYVVDNGYPGVMIWELSHDTPEEPSSLLSAIDRVVNP